MNQALRTLYIKSLLRSLAEGLLKSAVVDFSRDERQ